MPTIRQHHCKGKGSLTMGLLLVAIATPLNGLERKARSNTIDFGYQETFINGICIFWGGDASSGDFFRDLRREDSPDGPIYRKGKKIVEYYPEQLQVVIRVVQHECNERGVPSLNSLPITDDFAGSLRCKAEWKIGMHQETAKDFTVLHLQHKTRNTALGNEGISSDVIEYSFNLSGHQIPLASHLIVIVTDSQEAQLARLSAFP